MLTFFDGVSVTRAGAEQLMLSGHGSHIRSLRAGGAYAVHGVLWRGEAAGRGLGSLINDNTHVHDSLRLGRTVRRSDKPHNCKFLLVTDRANADASAGDFAPERARSVVVALRALAAGEELYADYGEEFWALELSLE